MNKIDIKVLALGIVGIVLILLALGGVLRAATSGEGLDPGTASAAFALLGAMVAAALGTTAASNNKKEQTKDTDSEDQ